MASSDGTGGTGSQNGAGMMSLLSQLQAAQGGGAPTPAGGSGRPAMTGLQNTGGNGSDAQTPPPAAATTPAPAFKPPQNDRLDSTTAPAPVAATLPMASGGGAPYRGAMTGGMPGFDPRNARFGNPTGGHWGQPPQYDTGWMPSTPEQQRSYEMRRAGWVPDKPGYDFIRNPQAAPGGAPAAATNTLPGPPPTYGPAPGPPPTYGPAPAPTPGPTYGPPPAGPGIGIGTWDPVPPRPGEPTEGPGPAPAAAQAPAAAAAAVAPPKWAPPAWKPTAYDLAQMSPAERAKYGAPAAAPEATAKSPTTPGEAAGSGPQEASGPQALGTGGTPGANGKFPGDQTGFNTYGGATTYHWKAADPKNTGYAGGLWYDPNRKATGWQWGMDPKLNPANGGGPGPSGI